MYVSKFRCTVLYAWMSVDGIQTCVDGVAEAIVAVRPHSANAARATPTRWMILLLFFMVPSVFPTVRVPQGAYFLREWGAPRSSYRGGTPGSVFRPGVGCPLREIECRFVPGYSIGRAIGEET